MMTWYRAGHFLLTFACWRVRYAQPVRFNGSRQVLEGALAEVYRGAQAVLLELDSPAKHQFGKAFAEQEKYAMQVFRPGSLARQHKGQWQETWKKQGKREHLLLLSPPPSLLPYALPRGPRCPFSEGCVHPYVVSEVLCRCGYRPVSSDTNNRIMQRTSLCSHRTTSKSIRSRTPSTGHASSLTSKRCRLTSRCRRP